MPSYIPTNDSDLSVWLGNFIEVANSNLTTVGLTAIDIANLSALKSELDNAIVADNTAREAARAASAAKQTANRGATLAASYRAKMIGANATISVALKEQLGLDVPAPRSDTPPITPIGVTVAPKANGVNVVTFKKSGNKPNTIYTIQQKTSQLGAWRIVGTTTRQQFDHANQVPGKHVLYRVFAQRAGADSAPSTQAVAYGDAAFPSHDNGIVD